MRGQSTQQASQREAGRVTQNYMVYTRAFINSLLLKEPNLVSGLKAAQNMGIRVGMRGQSFISFIYFNFRCLRQKQTKTKINLLVSVWCPV